MNPILLVSYALYIISLLVGFSIFKKQKDKLNKSYEKYRGILLVLIYILFSYVNGVLIYATLSTEFQIFLIAFILHIAFNIYFIINVTKDTRCYKQHIMIIYNFFMILAMYLCSLMLFSDYINLFIIPVVIYNIIEFQFAKFDFKTFKIWD